MDGGYYAIKGFEYQIDKTLSEVLSSTGDDTLLCLEQIQDINDDDFVMQVKYKEATKLTPSVIRKPILQLIEEFNSDQTKNYILYCYFGDTNGYTENVDLNFLNDILGKEKDTFTTILKNQFLTKFKLCFSKDFQTQFQAVLSKIQEFNFCNSIDEAVYFYSIMVDYLRKKVINNPPDQLKSRQVTKGEILNYLNRGRRITFLSAYKEYRGGQEYFKLLKARFKKPIKNQETIIITGKVIESDSCPFSSLIYQIIEKHYYKATHDIKPLTIIIPDEKVLEVKKYLIENNCPFNDGYETIHFSRKYFITAAIINKKTVGKKTSSSLSKTSFKARIISFSTFNSISELELNGSWILIDSEKHELLGESPYQIINNLETEQLLKLF